VLVLVGCGFEPFDRLRSGGVAAGWPGLALSQAGGGGLNNTPFFLLGSLSSTCLSEIS
jgi:hypothetical protein